MTALFLGLDCALIGSNRVIKGVTRVELESGGRKSWNVFGTVDGVECWHYVQTVD